MNCEYSNAYQHGYTVGYHDEPNKTNPYPKDTKDRKDFEDGLEQGIYDLDIEDAYDFLDAEWMR